MQIIALTAAGLIFLVVAIMHLVRLILRVEVRVGNFTIPWWFSIFGLAFALALSIWMFYSTK